MYDKFLRQIYSTHLECPLQNLTDGIIVQLNGSQIMQQMEARVAQRLKIVIAKVKLFEWGKRSHRHGRKCGHRAGKPVRYF